MTDDDNLQFVHTLPYFHGLSPWTCPHDWGSCAYNVNGG